MSIKIQLSSLTNEQKFLYVVEHFRTLQNFIGVRIITLIFFRRTLYVCFFISQKDPNKLKI